MKTWELGNEIWGDWVRGHSDADTYARNYLRYREAMLAVDPTLRFIAVGDNDMAWNRTLLSRAGAQIDYLAIHHYYGLNEAQREDRLLTTAHFTASRAVPAVGRGVMVADGFRNRPTVFFNTGGTGIHFALPPCSTTWSSWHSTKDRRSSGRSSGRGGRSGTAAP